MPVAYYDGAPTDRIRVMDGASSLHGRRQGIQRSQRP